MASIGRSAAAAAAMGVALAATWGRWTNSLAPRVALSFLAPAAYVGMLFLLREFSREDLEHVLAWLGRRLGIGHRQDPL